MNKIYPKDEVKFKLNSSTKINYKTALLIQFFIQSHAEALATNNRNCGWKKTTQYKGIFGLCVPSVIH